ncbi:hypothetical protein ACE3MZ_05010 [Paenibacillus sp. WLX1005]|uniref:hypothetical protein n=1 Tax=Paenibacillus sp. WLX1005 TaxID=3243766 RepID=UPI003983E6A6
MFAMGLTGGIFGIVCSVVALITGVFAVVLSPDGTSGVWTAGLMGLIFSILAIVSAAMCKAKPRLAGWLMLVSGIGGFFSVLILYLLPGILLVIGGFMGILGKKKSVITMEQI